MLFLQKFNLINPKTTHMEPKLHCIVITIEQDLDTVIELSFIANAKKLGYHHWLVG